jgi:ribonuclease D
MLLKTPSEVLSAMEQLKNVEYYAFDTEFIRIKTYYPELCLMQYALKDSCFVIDNIKLSKEDHWHEVRPHLHKFFQEANAVMVLHAASQDLEILHHDLCLPEIIFDTQLAARFLGFTGVPSYGDLVKHFLGIILDKKLQFSNWSKRPLSPAHLEYAIKDVIYLHEIYPMILEQLITSTKFEWFIEDMQSLRKSVVAPKEYDLTELKSILTRLTTLQEAEECYCILKTRQAIAKQFNINKQSLLSLDDLLLWLSDGRMLYKNLEVTFKLKDRFVQYLEDVKGSKSQWTDKIKNSWDNRYIFLDIKNDRLTALKQLSHKVSNEVKLAPELIASSKDLVSLINQKPSRLDSGWRHELFTKKALELTS